MNQIKIYPTDEGLALIKRVYAHDVAALKSSGQRPPSLSTWIQLKVARGIFGCAHCEDPDAHRPTDT